MVRLSPGVAGSFPSFTGSPAAGASVQVLAVRLLSTYTCRYCGLGSARLVGEHVHGHLLAQLAVHLHQRVRQRDQFAAAAAPAREELMVAQPRHHQRDEEGDHHGRHPDPAAGRGEFLGVRAAPLGHRGVLAPVPHGDQPSPQPQPFAPVHGEHGQVAGHTQDEHGHGPEHALVHAGGQGHAEQHQQRQPGHGGPVQPHREQVGGHGRHPDAGRGQQQDARGGRGGWREPGGPVQPRAGPAATGGAGRRRSG